MHKVTIVLHAWFEEEKDAEAFADETDLFTDHLKAGSEDSLHALVLATCDVEEEKECNCPACEDRRDEEDEKKFDEFLQEEP
jgi:hypothetical protein